MQRNFNPYLPKFVTQNRGIFNVFSNLILHKYMRKLQVSKYLYFGHPNTQKKRKDAILAQKVFKKSFKLGLNYMG